MPRVEIPGFKIRDISVSPGLILAPMSGVTSSAYRRLMKELNPGCIGLVVSEFISVEGMTRGGRRSQEMMRYAESERPFGIQIFGYDPVRMADAAKMVEESGADLVDINCGCPAPKVVKRGGGCELMRQPEHLKKIFSAVRRAVKIPLTMKMRSGWDESSRNAVEIAVMAESEGVEAITVHGRTRAQLYRGDADWSFVAAASRAVKIPVCGSGDVVDQASALERLSHGASGLYIGRGSIANPLIFGDIINGTDSSLRFSPIKVIEILERYMELLLEETSEKAALGKLKQLISRMGAGHEWRKDLCRTLKLIDLRAKLLQIKDEVGSSRAPSGAFSQIGL